MKKKHTQGEWRDVGSHVFASTQTEDKMYNICKLNNKRAEYKANSKLISAAPDMLEALKEIAKGEGAYDMDKTKHAFNVISNSIQLAKKAIIKAEGK